MPSGFSLCNDTAAGLMQMSAVVELTLLSMPLNVRHQSAKLHWLDVMQAKLLKPRRVNQRGGTLCIHPVQRGASRRVFARVERLRNFGRQNPGLRNQQVGQTAFTGSGRS